MLDTCPDRTIASSLTLTAMSSPGNSPCSCCSRVVIAGSTTMSYCSGLVADPDDQADSPGLFAIDQDLTRLHDDRVGNLGIGDRDAGHREIGRDHGGPAGGHDYTLVLRAAAPAPAAGAGCCGDGQLSMTA